MKAVVSEKGQVTIPKSVRAQLGLRPGTQLEFQAEAGVLIGRKVATEDVFRKWRGRGSLPARATVDDYLALARGRHANGR